MFHMTKNITCILEQIEFHLETSEMNLLQHVLQIFILNTKNKYWQVSHQCELQEILQRQTSKYLRSCYHTIQDFPKMITDLAQIFH
jgi:hypothetical protein